MTQRSEHGHFVFVPSQWKRFADVPTAAQIGRDLLVNNVRHGYDMAPQHAVNEMVVSGGSARQPDSAPSEDDENVLVGYVGPFLVRTRDDELPETLVVRLGVDQSLDSGVKATWKVRAYGVHGLPREVAHPSPGGDTDEVAATGTTKEWLDGFSLTEGPVLQRLRVQDGVGGDAAMVHVYMGSLAIWVSVTDATGVSASDLKVVGLHCRGFAL